MPDIQIIEDADEAPISLYLELEEGKFADLEVVANASVAFVDAIREIAFIIDPSISIRIEIKSGDQGSLSLNSIIRIINGRKKKATLTALILTVAISLGMDAKSWLVGKGLDKIIELIEDKKLSKEDVEDIAKKTAELIQKGAGEEHARKIYTQIEKDPAIVGLGVSPGADKKPLEIVPREKFHEKATKPLVEVDIKRRASTKDVYVKVIKPVLIEGKGHWRFAIEDIRFGAKVKDEDFVNNLLHGRLDIKMQSGIELFVQLETIEEKLEGVWRIKEWNILKVYEIIVNDDRDLFIGNSE